jgi:hypothetical protein
MTAIATMVGSISRKSLWVDTLVVSFGNRPPLIDDDAFKVPYKMEQVVKNRQDKSCFFEMCEQILQEDPTCLSPTPIGPQGVKRVVKDVQVSDGHWRQEEAIFDCLHPLLCTEERRDRDSISSRPRKKRRNEKDIKTQTGIATSSGDESAAHDIRIRPHQFELWSERFQDLLRFREKFDHCLVPHTWDENLPLAQWVKRQRYQYKLKKEGKHTTMTDERQMLLERLGFVWDSHGVIWEEKLNDLLAFRRIHGHCNVPSTFPENAPLSIWVKCQRRQYKLFLLNEKRSTSTPQRRTKLDGLGFVWNPRNLKKGSTPPATTRK